MKAGRLNIVTDLQWGSTGKGKLAFFLALRHDVQVAVCDFQTNAGHTVLVGGKKHVLQQLPVSAIKQDTRLLINPGATIDVDKLLEEVETHRAQNRLKVHPHAAVVTEKARHWEKENLKRISSTLKGVGATLGLKTMRAPETVLAKDEPKLAEFIADTTDLLHCYLRSGAMVIGEAAQGFDLSLNHGWRYPYVTSRDVTPTSFLSNAGVPSSLLGDVYGCVRTFPIRVGHQLEKKVRVMEGHDAVDRILAGGAPVIEETVKVGDSGPCYPDQMELTWEDLKLRSGAGHDIVERTTVTQKVRRVFTFSHQQFKRAIRICDPDYVFLNFANHIKVSDSKARTWGQLSEETRDFVRSLNSDICETWGVSPSRVSIVSHIGTGADDEDMVVLV